MNWRNAIRQTGTAALRQILCRARNSDCEVLANGLRNKDITNPIGSLGGERALGLISQLSEYGGALALCQPEKPHSFLFITEKWEQDEPR